MSQVHEGDSDQDSLQQERLREELRRRFPADAGYEVVEATWVEFVDGEPDLIPVTTVSGNGINLTFFPREPNYPPPVRRSGEAER